MRYLPSRPLLTACIIGALMIGQPADAAEATYDFNIESASLASALTQFAEQSGLQLAYVTRIAEGRSAPQLRGNFTAAQALRALLSESDLEFEQVDERTVAIHGRASSYRKTSFDQGASERSIRLAEVASGQSERSEPAETGESGPSVLEEITVTAQKREERLQDVAMSIQAFSGKQLEQMRAESFRDYALTVPGLSFVDQGPGQQQVIIRGLSSSTTVAAGDEPNNKETVGIYIDEVPVSANGFNPDLALFDIERVEVLRGPQGTLYGSGSMGGTVRTITRQPNLTSFENANRVSAGATRYGGFNGGFSTMLNFPVVEDAFALRLVGTYRNEDGFVDNVALGQEDVNDSEIMSGRIAAKWQASDDLSIVLKAFHQDVRLGGFQGGDVGFGDLEQYREVAEPLSDRFTLTNAEVSYSLPWGSILSSTSYMDRDLVDHPDLTWLIRSLEPVVGITAVPAGLVNTTRSRTFAQEVRLATDASRRLSAIVGAFYTKQVKRYGQSLPSPGFDALNANAAADFGLPDNLFLSQLNFNERQVALFGEASWRVTEQLTGTVGLRWFDVSQTFDTFSIGLIAANATGGNKTQIDDVNPKFLLSYKANDDALVYAQAAQGFRLGGANDLIPTDVCAADLQAIGLTAGPGSFDNDTIWNYELGAKTSWLQRRLVVNSAVYHIDWSNIQTTNMLPCGFGFKENAAAATVDGIELEVAAFPLDTLELRVGAAYTRTRLSKDVPSLEAQSGDRLPGVPELTAAITARQEVPLCTAFRCHLQVSAQYVGNSYNTFESNSLVSEQPSYGLGSVSFSLDRGQWSLTAFVDNVTDERATVFVNQRMNNRITRNRPRTAGLQATFNF